MNAPYRTPAELACSCADLVPNPCWSCSPWIGHKGPCPTPENHRCVRHGTSACNNCGRIVDHGNVSSDGVCEHTDADIYARSKRSLVVLIVGICSIALATLALVTVWR